MSNGGKKMVLEKEILSGDMFSINKIKKLYALCGKYPLKREYLFEEMEVPGLVHEVQEMLADVFED